MDDLIAWLQINCLPAHFRYEQIEVAAVSRLSELKIEAPRAATLERIINRLPPNNSHGCLFSFSRTPKISQMVGSIFGWICDASTDQI